MNSYAVAYTPDADDSLALAWLSATDRQAVAASQNQIDQFLSRDPRNPGREVREGLWRIEVPPLVAMRSMKRNRWSRSLASL